MPHKLIVHALDTMEWIPAQDGAIEFAEPSVETA